MKLPIKLLLSITTLFVFASCAEKDSDKIGDAQNCLDTATKSTVSSCLDKLGSLDNQAANTIRCAGAFIEEGFDDPSKFLTAFEQLEQSSSGGSSTLGFMGALAFSTQDKADNAVDVCKKSESRGFILLSTMTGIATTLSTFANLSFDPNNPPTQAQMEAALSSCTSDSCEEAIGNLTINLYESSCTNGTTSNEQVCEEVSQAMAAGSTPEEIGAQLLAILNNP